MLDSHNQVKDNYTTQNCIDSVATQNFDNFKQENDTLRKEAQRAGIVNVGWIRWENLVDEW